MQNKRKKQPVEKKKSVYILNLTQQKQVLHFPDVIFTLRAGEKVKVEKSYESVMNTFKFWREKNIIKVIKQ